jgi:iron complex transport system substrate-binding protein
MKKKIAILIGIAVCAILLASPMLASAGYSKIYGNANEDDVLDMRDVTYIKLVIFGKKPATDFADANYDGKISMLDIGQTKLIILGKEKELTLVDQADRTVTVPRPIERVVSSSLDGVRTLIGLGVVDKLVGISSSLDRPWKREYLLFAYPMLNELPYVGSFGNFNTELILSLKPDVIFVYGGGIQYTDAADTLQESIGIPVVCITCSGSLDFEIFGVVGSVIGKEKEAEELISCANEKIKEITEVTSEIPENEKPKVYLACWCREDITKTPVRYDPIDLAGGMNVAKGSGFGGLSAEVSKEQIIAWNPDIILLHRKYAPTYVGIEDVLTDYSLQTVNAVKNREVYYTKGFMRGWDPAVGVTETLYMAKLFHPDKFEDLDVEREGNEILNKFYGVDGLYTYIAENCEFYRWE